MLKTEELQVNIGPQHPSTHGVFRMLVTVDGESLVDLKPVFGYLHRNHEQIAEVNSYLQNIPFTDRLDYFNSMVNNHAYARAVEMLGEIEVPERAHYIRVIMDELSRILNHASALGFMLGDMGAWQTVLLWGLREREKILDLFEYVSGARMMCNYCRFGGVIRDIDDYFISEVKKIMDGLPSYFDDFEGLLNQNEILLVRAKGIGVLPKELAISYSVTGPVLRGSGVPYDVRKAEPYAVYDRFNFDVAVGSVGDVYDRYLVRIEEMRQARRIVLQALEQLPDATGGHINTKVKQQSLKLPAGEGYARVESPKGELGFYIVSDGSGTAYRYKVRAPSFINLSGLADMCKGYKVADVVVILGSIDIVMGEVDR